MIHSRARSNYLNKTNATHYELSVHRPTIQPDYDNFPISATSQTGLTEHQGNQWNGNGVDDVQTTFVKKGHIYVNSIFRGLCLQLLEKLQLFPLLSAKDAGCVSHDIAYQMDISNL